MRKIVYQIDSKGYYIGTDYMYNGILPNNCVEKEPPAAKEKYRRKWNGEKWVQEAIPKPEAEEGKQVVWNSEKQQYVQEDLPLTLDQRKDKLRIEMAAAAEHDYISGFESDAGGEKAIFDSSTNDQTTLLSMNASAQSPNFENDPTYKGFIPMRGVPEGQTAKKTYYLTATQMQQLVDDWNRHYGAVKLKHWTIQAQIDAATDETLDKITW